jgi:hypothetical protein
MGSHINFENKTISVKNKVVQIYDGNRKKSHLEDIAKMKNASSNRTLPTSRERSKILWQYVSYGI